MLFTLNRANNDKKDDQELILLKELVSQAKVKEKEPDKYDKFGVFIAEELRQLGEHVFKQAKCCIQQVVMEFYKVDNQNININYASQPVQVGPCNAANSLPCMERQRQATSNSYKSVSDALGYTSSLFDMDSQC